MKNISKFINMELQHIDNQLMRSVRSKITVTIHSLIELYSRIEQQLKIKSYSYKNLKKNVNEK